MSEKSVEKQCVVSCKGAPTRDWYAWNNLMPPKPDDFHVVGEVEVGNPGIVAKLYPRVPQGINPEILLMNLVLIQQPGIWPQIVTWIPARYDKVIMNSMYKRVNIFCEDNIIADIEVEDVH
ncbi:MAG: hypothetical protein QNJ63_05700 [Calothrix sp. MO_192.B10]|nr:hypothetical protein [Calothrix sp. MO_192.B10]